MVKEVYTLRKTSAKSAKVSVSRRHERFWKYTFPGAQSNACTLRSFVEVADL